MSANAPYPTDTSASASSAAAVTDAAKASVHAAIHKISQHHAPALQVEPEPSSGDDGADLRATHHLQADRLMRLGAYWLTGACVIAAVVGYMQWPEIKAATHDVSLISAAGDTRAALIGGSTALVEPLSQRVREQIGRAIAATGVPYDIAVVRNTLTNFRDLNEHVLPDAIARASHSR